MPRYKRHITTGTIQCSTNTDRKKKEKKRKKKEQKKRQKSNNHCRIMPLKKNQQNSDNAIGKEVQEYVCAYMYM